jgi:hypothetical protein
MKNTNVNTHANSGLKMASAFALSMAISMSAQAGLIIDITSATAGNSQDFKSSKNDIIGNQAGYFGASIWTDDEELTNITIEFLGSEAKWNSVFSLTHNDMKWEITNHPGGATGVVKANAGNSQKSTINDFGANQLLDFAFLIDNPANGIGADWAVSNANNGLPNTLGGDGRYFWTGTEYDLDGNIIAILLGLDDGGLLDEDNDDLVIRLTGFGNATFRTTEVPVPAAFGLFASAISLAAIARRRKMA